jgi:hypothetical protein
MGLIAVLWSPFRTSRTVLHSPLTPDSCIERVAAQIDGPFAFFGSRPLTGSVSSLKMSLNKRIWYGNSFRTKLKVILKPTPMGTDLDCRAGLSLWPRIFMGYWFGFLALWLTGALYALWIDPYASQDPSVTQYHMRIFFPLFAILMAIFGWGFVRFGRYLGRNEEAFLLDFIARITESQRGGGA